MVAGAAKAKGLLGEQVGESGELGPHVVGDVRVDAVGIAGVVVSGASRGRFEPFANRGGSLENVADSSDEDTKAGTEIEGSEAESGDGKDAENETHDGEDLVHVAFFPGGQG